jgi:hypothetical protein
MLPPIAAPDDPARACLAGPLKYQTPNYRARTQSATHRHRFLPTAIPFSCSSPIPSSADRAFQAEICPPRESHTSNVGRPAGSREDAKDSHEFCKHHALCRGSHGPTHKADASTAQHLPASRLRVQKTLSMSDSREDAKTRRIRMNFANIMRSAAAATARPTRLMLQLLNTNPLRDFACKKRSQCLTHAKTRRREGFA